MIRRDWDDLPDGVRHAVEAQCGPVARSEPAAAGSAADLTTTLHLEDGRALFCKGVKADSPVAWMHRNEARVNPWLGGLAPRLLWQLDTDGWLLLGFEHVDGRHANLSPGSADLTRIIDVMAVMERDLTPCPQIPLQTLSQRWAGLPAWRLLSQNQPADLDGWARENLRQLIDWETSAPDLLAGQTLAHTDLNARNFLIGDRVRVIDWAWPCRAAAWVDVAFLVSRLIDAGHAPNQAEEWAASVPAWKQASDDAVTAFAVAIAGLREHRSRAAPAAYRQRLRTVAQRWAQHRLG
ncbi:MAG: hypothetical protein ACRD0K_11360 [Egibacteraceae bacterium]